MIFQTLIHPAHVFNINSKNMDQFEVLGDDMCTVESQLKVIAWNRADSYVLKLCDGNVEDPKFQRFIRLRGVLHVHLSWKPDGILVTINDEEMKADDDD